MLSLQNVILLLLMNFKIGIQSSWTWQKGWYSGTDADSIEKLPSVLNISRYDIWLKPYFPSSGFEFHASKKLTFEGRLSITFQPLESLKTIQLNSAGLQINQVDLWLNDTRLTTSVKVERFKPILNIQLNDGRLEINNTYVLKFQYSGKIRDRSMGGLYYNNYLDERGVQRTMLATLLEPTKAHRVFPCVDHLDYKAIFQLTLVHPKNAQVFHNTLAENTTEISNELSSTLFTPTKPISTYLFAFSVGDFAIASIESKSGVKVRTIALKQFADYLPKSAKIAAKCIDSLEDILGVHFPLEKLDHLESPNSLVGAVENFGLIIYRGLLSVPENVSSNMRLTQELMICHEVIRFSGLVTSKDWNNMFLHESFAQFLMYKSVGGMKKEESDKELVNSLFIDEREDGLQEMHRLHHSIIDRQTYFDGITYKAGAAFIQMLEAVLGDEIFYKGLKYYLNNNQYSNANLDNLIFAFEKATKNKTLCNDITIRNLMEDYLFQPNYPTLKVTLFPNRFDFEQISQSNFKWNVPIFMKNLETKREDMIWLKKDGSLCNNGMKVRPDPNSPYIFNNKGLLFGRVEYSMEIFENLVKNVEKIDQTSQYAMLSDLMSGRVNGGLANGKQMAQNFINDVVNQTGTLSPLLASQLKTIYDSRSLEPVIQQLCETSINWDPKTLSQGYMSHSILRLAVENNQCNVSIEADKLFKDFLANCFGSSKLDKCNRMHGDIREAVYCYAVKNRHFSTLSNYLFWLNSTPNNLQFEYDEIPNVRHALKCR